MQISRFVRSLLPILLLVSPLLVRAQFKQPTDEELKMTADPKAPGADAVFLNIEDITDDMAHTRTIYARIKVLAEKGKELATVEIPYESSSFTVENIQARTIHADGTVIPLTGKPQDLLIFKTADKDGDQIHVGQKVFNLPSVEVGSILEYFYRIHYDENHVSSPFWEVQRPWFVHHARYVFIPFKGFLPGLENVTSMLVLDEHGNNADRLFAQSILPEKINLRPDVAGRYVLELNDIPPAPDENWMPPIQSILYQVRFYYVNGKNVGSFWVNEGKYWSKDVDRFAEPSSSIKDAVATLTAPGDTDLDKAQKLYKAVQALDNTDFSRKKSASELKQLKLKIAKRAEDTWAQKSGSSRDIALLYLAMLRAAGLSAYEMRVVDRDREIFDVDYLDFDQFDDDIVVLDIAGKEILLDPGEKMCPFQSVDWRHSSTNGIRESAAGLELSFSPPLSYTANTILRIGDITLDEHGAVTGDLRFVMSGQEALRWRQIALQNDPDEVKKQFDHELESMVPDGVEAHIDHFRFLDDPENNLIAFCNLHGTLGAATSKRLLLPGFFFQTRGNHPFVNQEKRLEPVDMHYAEQSLDKIVYHLPAGLTVEGAPQDNKISWEGHAIFVTRAKTDPGQITIIRQFSRAFTLAKSDEYQDLRGFYQKVAAADQQQLVLTSSSAAKGN